MLGSSPISPCLPPSVGSPASGALRPPSTDVPPPSSGSWGSGSFSLTTAPRWRSSPPLAALLCPFDRWHARSQSASGLRGHIVGTVIGSAGGHRAMDGVRLEVLVELLVVLGRLLVGIGLPGVL